MHLKYNSTFVAGGKTLERVNVNASLTAFDIPSKFFPLAILCAYNCISVWRHTMVFCFDYCAVFFDQDKRRVREVNCVRVSSLGLNNFYCLKELLKSSKKTKLFLTARVILNFSKLLQKSSARIFFL